MCGIAGIHLKDPTKRYQELERFADALMLRIENRGKQATGFVAVTADNDLVCHKLPVNASEFVKIRKAIPKNTRTLLAHTRWATKGSNENECNLHPVISGSCYLTHNGVINNDEALFRKYQLDRKGEVDTEIIPALIQKYGWENAGKAFEELEGSFAIAAIDENSPGKLMLARGDNSPLSIYETDSFLVWASLGYQLREAWGDAIGTPPKYDKLRSLKEGQILYVDGDKLTTGKFSINRPLYTSHSYNVEHHESSSTKHGNVTRDFTRGVIQDRRKEAKAIRDAHQGMVRIMASGVEARNIQRQEILKDPNVTSIIFMRCGSCTETILENDFIYSIGEGKICLDCEWIKRHDKKVNIDSRMNILIENWADKESVIHSMAVEEAAEKANLSTAAVEYLIYRAVPSKSDGALGTLINELDEIYQAAYANAWDELLGIAESLEETVEEKQETVVIPIVSKCPDCQKFVAPDKECVWCAKQKRGDERAQKALPKSSISECWCGEPSRVLLGNIAGFCIEHYERCNNAECPFPPHGKASGNAGIANHMRTDGKRVCHFCARGVKNVWSDTQIKNFGIIVQRATSSATAEPGGL